MTLEWWLWTLIAWVPASICIGLGIGRWLQFLREEDTYVVDDHIDE